MLHVAIHTEVRLPEVFEFPFDRRVTFGRAPEKSC